MPRGTNSPVRRKHLLDSPNKNRTPETGVTDKIIREEIRAHWSARMMRPVRRLYEWVLHWAETKYAGPALAMLSFSEAIFFPVPPDVLLMALCLGKPKRSFWYAASCTFWSIAGAMLAMYAGTYVGKERVLAVMQTVHLGTEADQALTLFHRYDFWAVAIAALTPVPYKVFAWLAGFAGCKPLTFLAASAIFRAMRFFGVAGLVYAFGAPAKRFIDRYFNLATVLVMIFLILLVMLMKYLGHVFGT